MVARRRANGASQASADTYDVQSLPQPAGGLVPRVLRRLTLARTPTESAEILLRACVEHTDSVGGEIYLLDLGSNKYRPCASTLPGDRGIPTTFTTETTPPNPHGPLNEFLGPGTHTDGIVVYANRGG